MDWLVENATQIGAAFTVLAFLLSVVVLAFTAYKYVDIKRKDQMQVEFDHYHSLIAQLVGSERKTTTMKLDSQVAIIYELKLPRFKRYRPVTKRILEGLYEEWKSTTNKRILMEIELAIEALVKN